MVLISIETRRGNNWYVSVLQLVNRAVDQEGNFIFKIHSSYLELTSEKFGSPHRGSEVTTDMLAEECPNSCNQLYAFHHWIINCRELFRVK